MNDKNNRDNYPRQPNLLYAWPQGKNCLDRRVYLIIIKPDELNIYLPFNKYTSLIMRSQN